jgi:hypothetical protein
LQKLRLRAVGRLGGGGDGERYRGLTPVAYVRTMPVKTGARPRSILLTENSLKVRAIAPRPTPAARNAGARCGRTAPLVRLFRSMYSAKAGSSSGYRGRWPRPDRAPEKLFGGLVERFDPALRSKVTMPSAAVSSMLRVRALPPPQGDEVAFRLVCIRLHFLRDHDRRRLRPGPSMIAADHVPYR